MLPHINLSLWGDSILSSENIILLYSFEIAVLMIYCMLLRSTDSELDVGVLGSGAQREECDPSVSVGAATGTQ